MKENKENNEVKQEEVKNQKVPETLTQKEAISVLVQAVEIGQKKGIYTFEESALIYKAIKTFIQK